jgi:iron complex outermembrane receptor protein
MLIIFFILIIIFPFPAFSEPYALEKIVVRPQRLFSQPDSSPYNYSSETFTGDDIEGRHLSSLIDLLDFISGVDLRYRGISGIQGDLSIRGSTYEQVAVLIDGVRINDPQTGHHNLDIPLTAFDIEKVEVIKEGSSAFCGAGAFAASVNIITRKPVKKSLKLDTVFGEHALSGEGLSFSLPQKDFSSRFSLEHKKSSGARPNTDFEYETASCYLNKESDKASFDALFGYQKKDFGADSFYSNLFPAEEEHTQTLFIRTGLEVKLEPGIVENNLFFRRHRDKFILNRNNPTAVNYHTTYVYGYNSNLRLPVKYGSLLLGIDAGADQIYSTNLGKHTRIREACSLGFLPELGERLSADFRVRVDHYQKWSSQESFNLGLGYLCLGDKVRIKGSLARAFRIPSFTELYYSDPANKGDAGLKVERADSVKLGLNFIEELMDLNLEGFYRKGRNLIDWTRTSSSDPWQATNLGRVDFRGIEFSSKFKPKFNFKGFNLGEILFSYSYTEADKKAGGFFSKYALDILKHQFILDMDYTLLGLDFNWQLSYSQRYYGEIYFLGNIYLGKKIINKNFTLEPFLKIDNFSDTEYSEVGGVLQPGRWVKGGLKVEW